LHVFELSQSPPSALSPWQNPFVERLIGSIPRECLDHVIVLSESHLRRILTRYFA
jgi:putative transposase